MELGTKGNEMKEKGQGSAWNACHDFGGGTIIGLQV